MLLEAWRVALRFLRPHAVRVSQQEHRIDLHSGGVFEAWSLDRPDVARGRHYHLAVIDEAAMVRYLEGAWFDVLRPTLADTRGRALFLSTPRGRNFFWQLWQRGTSDDDWAAWQMPTSANPHIDAAEIETMRHEMPERSYRQEIDAQFLDESGGVFRFVREAATAEPQHQAERDEHGTQVSDYVIGVDWGRTDDATVIAVVDINSHSLVYLDVVRRQDFQRQMHRLRNTIARFNPLLVVPERNSFGMPLVEQLQREGLPVLPFDTTHQSKRLVIDSLALAFEQSALRILDNDVLINELLSYEMQQLPSGTLRYGAPEGQHDDTVIALALAWHGARHGRVEYAPSLYG
jgi:phage terminase large subunit-like protein